MATSIMVITTLVVATLAVITLAASTITTIEKKIYHVQLGIAIKNPSSV